MTCKCPFLLLLMTINEVRFDDKCEMGVNDDLQGLMEDENWCIGFMS